MSNALFPKDAAPLKLYWFPISGHAHRAQLMLSLLDLPHELIQVDLAGGEQKQPDFLSMHPFGQVPVLDDNGTVIWDSVAILVYLAAKYDADRKWYPADLLKAVEVQQWLAVSAGPVFNGPCSARLVKVFNAPLDHDRSVEVSNSLLPVVEAHLADRAFLTGAEATIADVAGYSYIAHAPEGGVDLSPYPSIQAWLKRIEGLPGFVPMPKTEV